MPILTTHLLQDVIEIAQQAGEHLRCFYQRSVTVRMKEDNTPVTEADLFVSQFLTEKLTALTPQIPILSEENCHIPLTERQTWRSYWLIDPLDGTQQFINRTGQFSVLVSLVKDHQPVLGVIHAPMLGSTYYAMQGFGAYKHHDGQHLKLAFHDIQADNALRIAVGSAAAAEKVRSILNKNLAYEFHICGSSGLKSTLVADGVCDCYIRLGCTGEWDTAASEILLAEMGGIIFDLNYQPLTYNKRESFVNPNFVMGITQDFPWDKIFHSN
ncbi:3'(2'),5'-bisphosphate nucleotidase CysQ [Aggregatibacter actinomycetemcomitans]|uniref:3'(2'),5'-bisphosphate nucleotidase CysQ n=2 Tax=Aggregatibacter actinomycetemcomitans TaxID=714 RepID=CYSQ_AGGAC|nr:3'(2'),5'-bisphosphate nucleotidase CysQ [Aggregatibacter actinomycetemcomitans]P70714.1 RecName: Full=3'(2'),5'-bisphosphate nucleotidase CysQ; AltName: Full=3'(2'),5-bisphosphonucleoside 3'(2')-phosphohydrolase; AltName: Full=3'-phosphoadenosine 5'-phosphate phosphatase; Short=PAP phosphatase [Aggregatibacter actinomycetemcomitans]BAA13553.1 ammonium transport protein [Aggregatibacter actinomycetemcomitans Y4]ACX81925.1 3'-5'-bisphosphate nucleotidase [Aggregatibacter actinomycetemcomitans 